MLNQSHIERAIEPLCEDFPLNPEQLAHLLNVLPKHIGRLLETFRVMNDLKGDLQLSLYTQKSGQQVEGYCLTQPQAIAFLYERLGESSVSAEVLAQRVATSPRRIEDGGAGRATLPVLENSANLMPFDFNGHSIRVLNSGETPWFVARDVAEALEYSNTRASIRRHCKNAFAVQDLGGGTFRASPDLDPQTVMIPEGDLFRLMVKSKKPSAVAFEALVMDEILPTIRKTGQYGTPAPALPTDPQQLSKLLIAAGETIAGQNVQITKQTHALAVYERADGALGLRDAAKSLCIPEKQLIARLIEKGWVFRRKNGDGKATGSLAPMAARIKSGHMAQQTGTHTRADGTRHNNVAPLLLPKGVHLIAARLREEAERGPQAPTIRSGK